MRTPRPRATGNKAAQMRLPGVTALEAAGRKIEVRNSKIPHHKILDAFLHSGGDSGNLIETYRREVLPVKTRTIHLLGKKTPARIITTLLGYEVQASYKRIHCPDMVTARYLKLFSEIGCHSIKLPYDPTVTAHLIPGLEDSMDRVVKGVRSLFTGNQALQVYVLRRVCALMRSRLRTPS